MLGTRRSITALVASAALIAVSGSASAAPPEPASAPGVTTVVAVSIDGLNPAAIRKLGKRRTPVLHRLMRRGASTLNARTERELTDTLPNHTGMVTSRRITAATGGHGVTWNDDRKRPRTVQQAAGHPVASMFSLVHQAGLKTALFASKTKFSLFERSWDRGIDRSTIREDNDRVVRLVRRDIAAHSRALRFVHLSEPDVAGHAHGFMSPAYLDAVRRTDRRLGKIVAAIEADPDLADNTVVVVTADHGGKGPSHRDPRRLANYRIPFIAWGAGVTAGADLYDLNPDYADPGRSRTAYGDARQPVRNGDLANLVTDLLGLGGVPGSEHDAGQDLDLN